jgi:hypothetical protein
MSHEVAIDIPSLIRRESHQRPECLIRRYQLPEHYYPSYLRHPNQPFSSPSTISSSSSSPSSPSSSSLSSFCQDDDDEQEQVRRQQQNDLHLQSISFHDDEGVANESTSPVSIDGEFDVRIDIIQPSQPPSQPSKQKLIPLPTANLTPNRKILTPLPSTPVSNLFAGVGAASGATAPPISDDERDQQPQPQTPQTQSQPQQQIQQIQNEECVCVICYETFEQPPEMIRGRNYTSEELEDIEGKEKISNYCLTCKYDVHHKCIDEYRLSKMTDIIRSGYQRGHIQSPNISGIFKMKCLMCSKEVEKIHISPNGEINIEKTQPGANEQNNEQQQQQIEEIMRNRMQRRVRRRQRLEFCRKKICSICMMFLVTVTLLVFIFRAI